MVTRGGPPNKGTPKDGRLKENKQNKAPKPPKRQGGKKKP